MTVKTGKFMSVSLPEWLFDSLVDCGPGAYGDLAPELRARLKSQIAFLHHCLGESPAWRERRQPWLDRSLTRRDDPLDWVLFGIAESYASGPGLLAALLPALLAGCATAGREVLICRLAESARFDEICQERRPDLPLALSAALELAGQEQLFALSPARFVALYDELAGASRARGRTVLLGEFHNPPDRPCARLPGRVRLVLDPACGADRALLRWAQPGADIIEAGPEESTESGSWLALLSHRPAAYNLAPDLRLAPGGEALWLWPELPPSFFRFRRADIG
ncbi:MAG: hypothetical protein LBM64_08645 [Deltaproteobacteria bacterium]|nr:hypothetical protein [Deltaproteobacteria bacterium]